MVEGLERFASLSAILLDADYYGWVRDGRIVEDNLSFVRAEHLIPLKARAWLDLSERKDRGDSVSSSDIKKHKNDVFRLMLVIDPEYAATIPARIASDMERFATRLIGEPIDLPSLGIRKMKPNEAIEQLRSM